VTAPPLRRAAAGEGGRGPSLDRSIPPGRGARAPHPEPSRLVTSPAPAGLVLLGSAADAATPLKRKTPPLAHAVLLAPPLTRLRRMKRKTPPLAHAARRGSSEPASDPWLRRRCGAQRRGREEEEAKRKRKQRGRGGTGTGTGTGTGERRGAGAPAVALTPAQPSLYTYGSPATAGL
jgi:hypothetical protein